MEVTIVTNGQIKDMEFLQDIIQNTNYIICADGAAEYLRYLNTCPNILVGDLDSINEETLNWINENKVKVERFPVKKDMTDTELAVEFALKQNPSRIVIVGATGSRLDHSLSNIMLLYKINGMGIDAAIVDELNYVAITKGLLKLNCEIGQTLSLIPIGGDAEGVSIEGLEYPLINSRIKMGSSLGISNKSIKDEVIISVRDGSLLVIKVASNKTN